jgi:Zn-dependent M28 family amino/carboxypeptidase
MARVLAPLPLGADVYLCAFDGEELGLFGSEDFARRLVEQGVAVEGMATNDIVGSSTGPDGVVRPGLVRCFSEALPENLTVDAGFRNQAAENDGASRQLARYAALLATRYLEDLRVKLIYRADRFGRGGDHLSFNRIGAPAIRFTEPAEDYRHQHEDVREEDGVTYGDRLEFVDFDYVGRISRLNLVVALNGALAPPAPRGVRLRGAVRHDTTVSWEAVESEDLSGYRVWRRESDRSEWQEGHFVPAGTTEITLPFVSIDDWQFAVSSVGKDGVESPPAFPAPRASRGR